MGLRCGGKVAGVEFEFGLQREQPAPAIGPLEAARGGAGEVSDFGGDVGGRHRFGKQRADARRGCEIRIAAQDAGEQPVAMDAGMPVERAEIDGVCGAWADHVVRARHHVVHLVRILARDMAEREAGELLGQIGRELGHAFTGSSGGGSP